MQELLEQFRNLGIARVLLVDNEPANLAAARDFAAWLPGIDLEFCSSGKEACEILATRHTEFGLVVTDLMMETDTAGFDVFEQSWRHMIPAVIVSGGHTDGHYPGSQFLNVIALSSLVQIKGTKREARGWADAVGVFFKLVAGEGKELWESVQRMKQIVPDACMWDELVRMMRMFAEHPVICRWE